MLNKLKNFNWTKGMFLVPILLVAGISISHVVSWYDMANPYNWAVYLSIAIEVGAMTSLIAATKKIKGGVWFMFGLVTFIQMVGNIFYSYVQINETGELFKKWIELTSPVFEMMGTDAGDIIPHKRWLSLLEGGLLPLISLTALHFYIKYDDGDKGELTSNHNEPTTPNHNNPTPEIMYPADSSWSKWNKPHSEVVTSVPDGMEFNKPYPIPPLSDYPKNEDGSDKTYHQLGKYDLKFGPEYTKMMEEIDEEMSEEETEEPTPEIRDIIEEVSPELIESIEPTIDSREIKEELEPKPLSTHERVMIEDRNRTKVLSVDDEGKKVLTYKRNKITQKRE